MKATFFSILIALALFNQVAAQTPAFVDYKTYEDLVAVVKQHRTERLLPLDQFLKKAKERNTIILDTRSRAMYDLKHVKGAFHLNFSDFTQDALDSLLAAHGGPDAQILIYCNNNFIDTRARLLMDAAFITKSVRPIPSKLQGGKGIKVLPAPPPLTLALNIPTYINLYGYGYRNVYELSELVDVNDPRISFEGSFNDRLHSRVLH